MFTYFPKHNNNSFKALNYGVFMGLAWLEDKIANIMEKYRKR